MSDILKVAEQLNSEVTRLNNERSKLVLGLLGGSFSARFTKNFIRFTYAWRTKYMTL